MPLNDLYAKNNQSRKIPYLANFDETPRFWYPHVARDAWIDFNTRTVEIRSLEYQKNPLFCVSLFSLSLSIRFFFFFPVCFPYPSFFSFSFSFSPPLSTKFSSFLLFSPTSISHLLIFSSLSFSSLYLFLHFLFSPLILFDRHPHRPNLSQKWGKLPPTFPLATCHSHLFP